MAYDIKNVFYLDVSADITKATAGTGSAQLDLSAYIDPIARGRQKGTGLAVYKTYYSIINSEDQNEAAPKPWKKEQMESDNHHQGKTFDISLQTSAVIVIFGVSTVLFTLVVTGYLYSIPVTQDTEYLLKPNLLWLNTLVLLYVAYFFNKITNDLKKNNFEKIKKICL